MSTKAKTIGGGVGAPVVLQRERMPAWSAIVTSGAWVRAGIVAALIAAVYAVDLNSLAYAWTYEPDWTHGWLIPLISAYLVHLNRDRLAGLAVRPSVLGAGLMLAAAAMYMGSIIAVYGYPRPLSLVIMIFGTVLLLGGWRMARAFWFPIFLLLFAIPLPSVGYFYATLPLRRLVTLLTTGFLNLMPALEAQAAGTVIQYVYNGVPGEPLNVEEACSGMRLMMAFLAMGAIMAYLMREKPLWHRVVLLGACVPIAIFCNFIRVTITSVLYIFADPSLATGGAHAVLGLAMMLVALSLYSLVNWGLSSLLVEERAEAEHGVEA